MDLFSQSERDRACTAINKILRTHEDAWHGTDVAGDGSSRRLRAVRAGAVMNGRIRTSNDPWQSIAQIPKGRTRR